MANAGVTPVFKNMAFKNETKSRTAGRPIFDDVEMVEIRFAGTKDYSIHPVTEFSHWETDQETGEQRRLTYAERWPRQFRQFREREQQTKSGTPLDYLTFLTNGKKAELRALAIYTIEALAELDGQPLKNLGLGGRELKNRAMEYLASSDHNAVIARMQQQIDALMAQNSVLQDDRQLLASGPKTPHEGPAPIPTPPEKDEEPDDEEDDGHGDDERAVAADPNVRPELVGMSRDELKSYITEQTGRRPVGNPSLRNLTRIAQELGR
jgi:hypothetical protein